ncbi:nanoRNase/pAp phosphatase (c-di-AMP/oligoRNAs hydrolase) [Streptosporangium sandarakinum]|uniref:NanoRNase/pAp phosphatase (C-di-AMP/oligoRNAs hydrolase) n=1 Tax=Streptosporangium sandarakinum TaxID=1260955 RepID=A0A852UST1_9ACTN|nr:nanoRNase/pAp phosphatase (c-di-AMP/oligoRNAs hydrolase) [Streptosporangium sandarakinum]
MSRSGDGPPAGRKALAHLVGGGHRPAGGAAPAGGTMTLVA